MDNHQKLLSILKDFDTAMLVTQSPDGAIVARPMHIAQLDDDGGLWFVSERDSGKIKDVKSSDRVAVTVQSSNEYASVVGTVNLSSDRQKIEELWTESWRVWFPLGKDDPSLCLMHIVPETGEYWDNSGAEGVKYLLKAGQAYLKGEKPNVDQIMNAKVSM